MGSLYNPVCVGLLCAALLYTSGCGCNDIGCGEPSVEIDFLDPVRDGVVEVEVDTGEAILRCIAEAPALTDARCDEGISLGTAGPETASRTAVSQGASDQISGVFVGGEHARLAVRVFVDDTMRAEASIEPNYRNVEPNACEPCRGARASILLAEP